LSLAAGAPRRGTGFGICHDSLARRNGAGCAKEQGVGRILHVLGGAAAPPKNQGGAAALPCRDGEDFVARPKEQIPLLAPLHNRLVGVILNKCS
jgi:hypothetical protein